MIYFKCTTFSKYKEKKRSQNRLCVFNIADLILAASELLSEY